MAWQWVTRQDQRVAVDKGDGLRVIRSRLVPGVVQTARRTLDWLPLAAAKAEKYDVPVTWPLAVIFAESGGKPDAENWCCAGLMAIYYDVHGKRREDMLDPEKNVDYGTSLLARSADKGYELPEVASIHVAGGGYKLEPRPMASSPWGMAEHLFDSDPGDGASGYIERVVRANNMFADILEGRLDLDAEQPVYAEVPPDDASMPAAPPAADLAPALRTGGVKLAAFAVGVAAGVGGVLFGLPSAGKKPR